jgi:HEAT repeat protein
MRCLFLAILAVLLSAAPGYSQKGKKPAVGGPIDIKGKTNEEALTLLIPGMARAELPDRNAPQQQWQEICLAAGAPGNEAKRLEVCKLMIAKLGADVPDPARFWLLKQLEYIGRAESVATVAKVIDDPSEVLRESAIRCLANNPAEEATAALVGKMSAKNAKTKVALANALGYRRATSAVSVLAGELTNESPAVAQAAARALGRIASADAAAQLNKARAAAKDPVRLWICDAYLLCADQLMKDGKTKEAAAIYKDLYDTEKNRATRMAALEGVLRSAGDDAGSRIVKLLTSDDRDARNIALLAIADINSNSLKTVAGAADKLPVQAQVLLLGALANRREKSQAALALKASQSADADLQRAGILALGSLGDVSAVTLLVETAFSKSKHAEVARASLGAIAAPGVDEKLIALLAAEKQPSTRMGLITIVEARGLAAAVPVLLEDARGDDAGVRQAAMKALGKLAEAKDVGAMIPGILKAAKGAERENAEKAIAAVVARIGEPDKRADAIVAAVSPENRADLLPLLGRIGGPKALALARNSLDTKDRSAAVLALANWPDYSVSDVLLDLAKNAPEPELKKLAFKNLARVNALDKDHPVPPRFAVLKQAMAIADDVEKKKAVIDALSTIRDMEALRMVVLFLDDKQLNQAACKTIVELAHSKTLRQPNQAEFVRVLDRVLVICRDKDLIERAKKYKADK